MSEKRKRKLTEAEIKELCEVKDCEWFTITEYAFYAIIKDGKVTVPKEVLGELELKAGDFARVAIEMA